MAPIKQKNKVGGNKPFNNGNTAEKSPAQKIAGPVFESELQEYRILFDSIPDAVSVLDKDMKLVLYNPVFEEWSRKLGNMEARKGRSIFDICSNVNADKIKDEYMTVFKTGKNLVTEETNVFKGREMTTMTCKIPVFDGQNVVRVITIIRNITGRKRSEQTIKDTEKVMANVFSSIQDGLCIIDRERNIIQTNPMIEGWYKNAMPVVGKKCYEVFWDRQKSCENCVNRRTMEAGETAHNVIPRIDANGKTVGWREVFSYPLVDAGTGQIRGVVEYIRDITKQRQTEEELRESERKYKELWNNAPVAYHTLNTEGVITAVNQTELKMLGYTLDEMVRKPIFNFIAPEQRDDARGRFGQKIKGMTGMRRANNRIYVRKDGSRISVSVDDTLEFNLEGKVTGVRTTLVNITERKVIEDKLTVSLNRVQKMMEDTIHAMAKIVEMRDPYTAGHQLRVANLACAIARELGLADDVIDKIRIAGLLHDIGKINVPIEILSKPGRISSYEFNIIKIHPGTGYEILKEMDLPSPIAEIVLQHHERLNGSGYPAGLVGNNILLEARIMSIADVVEAMSSHRPYRPSIGIADALNEVAQNKGVLYDPDGVDVCLALFQKKGYKFE